MNSPGDHFNFYQSKKTKMKIMIILLSMVLAIGYAGCKKPYTGQIPQPPQGACDNIDSRFAAKVFPIIQNSCATNIACHANGSASGPGALTNYTQISNSSVAIRAAVISGFMPRGSILSTDEKNIISCWVNSGAPDN